MPIKFELEELQATLAATQAMIAARNPDSDPIGYFQLNIRKEQLEKKLDTLRSEVRSLASIALIFGGDPVVGARSISADFAGKALDSFQSLVTRRFAEIETGDLGKRGPTAMERSTKLAITDTVRGSFGFLLEEESPQTSITDTELKAVVSDVTTLIEKISSPDEERYEEAMSSLDGRTLGSLKVFLGVLDDDGATMKLVDDHRSLEFNKQAIHRARVRADQTDVEDRETDYILGVLQGLLPDHRKFEFKSDASGQVIYGSITTEFAKNIRGGNTDISNKRWRARFRVREVRQRNLEPKLSYVLIELAEP